MRLDLEIVNLLNRVISLEAAVAGIAGPSTLAESVSIASDFLPNESFHLTNGNDSYSHRIVRGGVYLNGAAVTENASLAPPALPASSVAVTADAYGYYGLSPSAAWVVFIYYSAATARWALCYKAATTFPATVAVADFLIPLYTLAWDSAGYIDPQRVVQHHWGDVHLGGGTLYDNKSLNLNASGQLQDYGWATAASIGSYASLAVTDLFMFQGYAGGADPLAKNYISMDVMLDAIAAWIILDGAGPWGDGNAPWEAALSVLHQNLDFTSSTVGNSGGNPNHDDHLMVKGASITTSANTTNYCAKISRAFTGTVANDQTIDLTASALYDEGTPSVARLKWDSTPQLLSNWECTGKFNQTTDTADATGAAGASLTSAGGIDAAGKVWALGGFKADVNNVWNPAAELSMVVPSAVTIKSFTTKTITLTDDAGVTISISGAGINLLCAGGPLAIAFDSLTINSNAFTLMTRQFPDGSGGTEDIEFIGRVV